MEVIGSFGDLENNGAVENLNNTLCLPLGLFRTGQGA
jgi:hypothetical protein